MWGKMKEQLYTIPVNDEFDKDCECPVCGMYRSLQDAAIDFTMGPTRRAEKAEEAEMQGEKKQKNGGNRKGRKEE